MHTSSRVSERNERLTVSRLLTWSGKFTLDDGSRKCVGYATEISVDEMGGSQKVRSSAWR